MLYSEIKMVNFLQHNQQKLLLTLHRAWVRWSVTLPALILGPIFLLLIVSNVLQGASPADAFIELSQTWGPKFLHLNAQLAAVALVITVINYGVGRQLIAQTLRRPLSAPLASLATRLNCWLRWAAAAPSEPLSASAARRQVFPVSAPSRTGLAPPVALLTGSAPLLE